MVTRVTWLLCGILLPGENMGRAIQGGTVSTDATAGVNPGARDEENRRGEREAETYVCDALVGERQHEHCLLNDRVRPQKPRTVLTRAHIDENFADTANWIYQIEEVRHRLGPSVQLQDADQTRGGNS